MRGEEQVRLDPLGDVEVQRALALARARESYPLLPRDTLVLYCDAAWEAARRADPKGRDLVGAFDRALLTIAWTHRRTGGRVPLHELVEQTIPRIALQPFIAAPAVLAEDELEEPAEAEPAVAAARRPVFRRPLLRVPFTSPLPVGAAVAAGAIGIALLHETRVLPIAPLEQSANDDLAASDDSPARMGGGSEPAPAVEGPLAAIGSGATSPPVFAAPGPGQSGPASRERRRCGCRRLWRRFRRRRLERRSRRAGRRARSGTGCRGGLGERTRRGRDRWGAGAAPAGRHHRAARAEDGARLCGAAAAGGLR